MSLFSIIGLYQTLLLEGSFRGVGFAHVTGSDEPGRRIMQFLFPGQDMTAFQDLGQYDGDITVNGLIVGDDYVARANAMRDAFQKAGPGTLISPWLGSIQVMQTPNRAPKFSFDHEKLRVCTFTATFRLYKPRPIPAPDTLQGLLNQISALRTAALQMLATILAPIALTLSTIAQVEAMAGEVATILGSLVGAVSSPLVGIAGGLPIALLTGVNTTPPDGDYPARVGALLAAPTSAIAGTTTPIIPSAVAPGGSITTPDPVDGRVTATLILAAQQQLGAVTLTNAPIVIPPGPALILAVRTLMVADATYCADQIAFVSQGEATDWRDRITAAIDAAILAAAALASTYPTAAAALWRALLAARAAWIAEMNSIVGSLARVITFTPPAGVPVWVLAQFLAGDDPASLPGVYRDLIARNGIVHPAEPPPGPFEVLA